MNSTFIFAYFVMPFVVGSLGVLAYYLHVRADHADRRRAETAERAKG